MIDTISAAPIILSSYLDDGSDSTDSYTLRPTAITPLFPEEDVRLIPLDELPLTETPFEDDPIEEEVLEIPKPDDLLEPIEPIELVEELALDEVTLEPLIP